MNKTNFLIIDVNKQKFITRKVFKNLKKEKIIIFRNLFKKNEIIKELKFFKKKKYNITKKSGDYFVGKKNFSRLDRRNKNSSVYARFQYFHALFTWNKDKSFKKIIKKLLSLETNFTILKVIKILYLHIKIPIISILLK